MLRLIAVTLLLVLGTFAERTKTPTTTATPTIKVSYEAMRDPYYHLMGMERISMSGATFVLQGPDGQWEKTFEAQDYGIEAVEFTDFNPAKPHTITVKLRNIGMLNRVRPGKGYESGEAFKFTIPTGSNYDFNFAPAECDGKNKNTWIIYSLFHSDHIIGPIGYEKVCKSKRRWIWQR